VPGGGGEEPGGNGGAGEGAGDGGTGGGDGGSAPPAKPALNSGASAAVDSMSVASVRAIWDTQFSALHLRQQNLRDFIPRPSSGTFWAQGYGGDYKLDNGYGSGVGDTFDTTVEGVSIGFDKVLRHTDDFDVIGGLYASFVNEDRSADESNGNLHGYSVGAYATWMHRSGWYAEGMMAYGNFNNSFSAAFHGDPSVSRVSADDWRIASAAVALEVGREFLLEDGWSVQPAIGFRYLHEGSQHFTTDLGHQVSSDGIGSSGVNASVTVSRVFRDGGTQYRPYLRFGYAHEFNGTQNVQYAGASIDTELDASRGFVDVGLAASIAKRHEVFIDYQYQKGHNIENTYLVNLGYRYTF
jgi:outer membrane autotransporter protein